MRNFQDTFKVRKRSFISTFSICMAVPLSENIKKTIQENAAIQLYKTFSIKNLQIVYENQKTDIL